MPDIEGWEELKKKYTASLENIINPPIPEPTVEIIDHDEKKEMLEEKVDFLLKLWLGTIFIFADGRNCRAGRGDREGDLFYRFLIILYNTE